METVEEVRRDESGRVKENPPRRGKIPIGITDSQCPDYGDSSDRRKEGLTKKTGVEREG